jgi:hypothetical protein
MAFDEALAARVRKALGKRKGLTEKKMFGGIAFLLHGNMCCGVHRNDLIVRLAAADTEKALKKRHTRVFDLTGRPMRGWVLVEPAALATDASVSEWVSMSSTFAGALPRK